MPDERPNIIVVLTDDQGFGQIPVFADAYPDERLFLAKNTERYRCDEQKAMQAARACMPNLAKLAGNGVAFMNAHVTSPLCAPSRAGLMTGRYPQRFGIYHNDDIGNAGVPVSETFMSEPLQAAGYRTAMVGKWHLGKMEPFGPLPLPGNEPYKKRFCGCPEAQHPMNRGFDRFFGFNGCGTSYYDSPCLFRGFDNVKATGYTTDEFTDEAVGFIEDCADSPFFLYLAYNAVHTPIVEEAPERYRRFDTGNPEADRYYAYLAAVDEGLGRITASLEGRGQLENTLIVYLSDNGAVIDSPQPLNGPFRGYKGVFRHGGMHVPMFAHWPAKLAPAKVTQRVISLDIMPTALAAAGVELPGNLDGVDLLPHIEQGTEPHAALYWAGPETNAFTETSEAFWAEHWEYITERRSERPSKRLSLRGDASWAVQRARWLLRCNEEQNTVELYDMEADTGERDNVAGQHPDLVQSIRSDFKSWAATLSPPLVWDRERFDRLAAE